MKESEKALCILFHAVLWVAASTCFWSFLTLVITILIAAIKYLLGA